MKNSNNLDDSSKSSEKIQSVTEAAGDVNNNKVPGAQTSVQSITATYTLYDIKIAASRVKAYIESNKKLPDHVQVGTSRVTMPQFLKLLTAGLLKVKSGSTSSVTLKSVGNPSPMKPTINLKTGNIYKTEYLVLAGESVFLHKFIWKSSQLLFKYPRENSVRITCVHVFKNNELLWHQKCPAKLCVNENHGKQLQITQLHQYRAALQIYLQQTNNCQSARSDDKSTCIINYTKEQAQIARKQLIFTIG